MMPKLNVMLLSLSIISCTVEDPDSTSEPSDGTGGSSNVDGAGGVLTMGPLCDESNDVRLAVTLVGGDVDYAYDFTNPFGDVFLLVTGTCDYFVSSDFQEGVFQGHLDSEEGTSLESAVGWGHVGSWGALGQDVGCTSGPTSIYVPGAATDCSCGCDEDAPEGKAQVFNGIYAELDALQLAATALDGPVKLLLVTLAESPDGNAEVLDFPFQWDPGEMSVTREEIREADGDLGVLIDDQDEADQLRQIRSEQPVPDQHIYFRTNDDRYFEAFVIDALPDEVHQSAKAFLDR